MLLETSDSVTLPGWAVTMLVPAIVGLFAFFWRWNVNQDKALHRVELQIANELATKKDLTGVARLLRKVYDSVIRLEGQMPGRRRNDNRLGDLDDDENDD